MVTYCGMLAVFVSFPSYHQLTETNVPTSGLALESLITLLTAKFIPFFMLTWIICNTSSLTTLCVSHITTVNISVCEFPIQAMPNFYRYGYAAPLYVISRAIRTLVFGTKNQG